MIRKILLAVDRSIHAEKTARESVELAKLTSASVVVMHAFSPPALLRRHLFMLEELQTSLETEAKELVGTVAELFQAERVSVSALAVEGPAVEAILRAAEAEKPDLIVMGSRGEGGMPGVLLGSAAERVLRHSTVSVLVVK
jgi:nucleotide-binding universal stress UspA family protein